MCVEKKVLIIVSAVPEKTARAGRIVGAASSRDGGEHRDLSPAHIAAGSRSYKMIETRIVIEEMDASRPPEGWIFPSECADQ
jgi:hypothetical protein